MTHNTLTRDGLIKEYNAQQGKIDALQAENAEHKKVRREVADEMAHWYPPERSMEDPATVRRIAEWRAKLLEGLEAE